MARWLHFSQAMKRFSQFLLVAVSAAVSFAQTPVPEFDEEQQPGVLRVAGIGDTDRVLLDGELIGDGRRLARFGSKLLVQPGDYTVTILRSDSGISCKSRVTIRENATVTARCSQPVADNEVEVD